MIYNNVSEWFGQVAGHYYNVWWYCKEVDATLTWNHVSNAHLGHIEELTGLWSDQEVQSDRSFWGIRFKGPDCIREFEEYIPKWKEYDLRYPKADKDNLSCVVVCPTGDNLDRLSGNMQLSKPFLRIDSPKDIVVDSLKHVAEDLNKLEAKRYKTLWAYKKAIMHGEDWDRPLTFDIECEIKQVYREFAAAWIDAR
jgi:hypothetical protein